MIPAPGEGTVAQEAERVATAICSLVTRMVIEGHCSQAGGIAGVRWAGLTMQASIEDLGIDTSDVERIIDELVAALEASTLKKGQMQ